ncbi:hypothetical protein BDY21DRAFT_375494 [Lineolata rhizophorae]|uniref:Uncharacterized protein n=1 Tax=Lineolata rhizophorae TaxID=578093 RepID=A0A6A6NMC2_9PEZI|nr:hypothetical protein BDY21DRAFT_375494 [Lineolata rhizophorae]
MSERNSPPLPSPGVQERRRASITGATFVELFGARQSISSTNAPPQQQQHQQGTQAYQGPITSAAAQANRRRLSLTTIGLSGSPNQSSPFGTMRSRTGSISSASVDESPFEDSDGPPAPANNTPATPFGRRLSFGARALRDVRAAGNNSGGAAGGGGGGNSASPNGNGRAHLSNSSSSKQAHQATPTAHGRGGFDFSENLRTRAERQSMSSASHPRVSPPAGASPSGGGGGGMSNHHARAKSVAIMEPPPVTREAPKVKAPDAFQERILKGDFYMD